MSLLFKRNSGILLLILALAFLNARHAWAEPAFGPGKNIECKALGLISPSRAIECVLAKFGITEEVIQENAKYMNVANYKMPGPQVTVTFTSTDPRPGEELTATAQPLYFSNPPEKLYFTWYLQPGDCPPSTEKKYTPGSDDDKRCNLNKDYDGGEGVVDVEDYKIKAMRIYASDGFDHTQADYTDSDGKSSYLAIHGGADQIEKNNHCFFHDTTSGEEYEFQSCFHLFPDAPGYTTGDNSFNKGEESFWHTNPEDPDTADTGNPDEANVTGLGAKNFTWVYQSGDKLGVAIEGIAYMSTLYKDSSYKIMWAIPNNTCSELQDYEFEAEEESGEPIVEIDPEQWPDCPDGCEFTRTLAFQRAGTQNEKAPFSSYNMQTATVFVQTQTIRLASRRVIAGETTVSVDITGGEGSGTATSDIGTETAPYEDPAAIPPIYNHPIDPAVCNGLDTTALQSTLSANSYTVSAADVIDESNNLSCCDTSIVDEMGAPLCSVVNTQVSVYDTNDMDISQEGSLFDLDDEDKEYMNACLMENILTPTEGGGKYENIEVNLSFSPENPVNDISDNGDDADWINVVSSVENSSKSESLHYQWRVFAGSSPDADSEDWEELTKDELTQSSQTSGVGVPTLKFKANFKDEPKYLKVRVDVSEKVASTNAEKDGTRKGNAQVIIPLSSFANKFIVKRAVVDDTLEITPGAEICKTVIVDKDNKEALADAAICPVLPDEILAVEANITPESGETLDDYDFLWTLNGVTVPQAYPPGELPGKIVYFPILFEKGTYLNLKLVATSQETGKKISLNRAFLVTEPSFQIGSTDDSTAYPELLGHYTNLEEEKFPNYSKSSFLAKKGATLSLAIQPISTPPPSSSSSGTSSSNSGGPSSTSDNSGLLPDKDDLSLAWYYNDAELKESESEISFTPPEDEGEESSSQNSSSNALNKEGNSSIFPTEIPSENYNYENSELENEIQRENRDLPKNRESSLNQIDWLPFVLKAQAYNLNTDNFSISVKGFYTQDLNTKKALNKYWGVQINEFYEKYFTATVDFSVVDDLGSEFENAQRPGRKILASFISSVPAYFSFLFRIVMTTFVMISSAWILFSLFPNIKENE